MLLRELLSFCAGAASSAVLPLEGRLWSPKRPHKLIRIQENLLYYTILYYTILYYTILYYTILYYTILYYTILYYTILYYTIVFGILLRVGLRTRMSDPDVFMWRQHPDALRIKLLSCQWLAKPFFRSLIVPIWGFMIRASKR